MTVESSVVMGTFRKRCRLRLSGSSSGKAVPLGDGTAELLWRVVHAVEVEALSQVVGKVWQCGLDEVVETM